MGLEVQLDDCIAEIWLGSIDWSILSRVSLLSSRDWYSLLFKLSRFDITLLFLSVSDNPINANVNVKFNLLNRFVKLNVSSTIGHVTGMAMNMDDHH